MRHSILLDFRIHRRRETAQQPVEVVKALACGVKLGQRPQMPFPHQSSDVAVLLKHLGPGSQLGWEAKPGLRFEARPE